MSKARLCTNAACRRTLPPGGDCPCQSRTRVCLNTACQQVLPAGRRLGTCAACTRAYMREYRARQRGVVPQYCGTCGCPGRRPCCGGAPRVAAVPWEHWEPEAARVGRLLQAEPADGVMAATALAVLTGWTTAQLRQWGRRLGTPEGACQSPYLYTDNALGLLFFLTPRARATPS